MNAPDLFIHTRWAATLATALFALSGCGGSDGPAPDPLAAYRTQTLAWQECDTTAVGVDISGYITAAGERLRCASVRVPMDWSAPERGDLQVAVMRLAAAQPQARQGALLFNPGGPGGDGLSYGLVLWSAFGDSNPQSPLGAQQLRLLDEFDMVGF